MGRMRGLKTVGLVACSFGIAIACSSTSEHPPPAGGVGSGAGVPGGFGQQPSTTDGSVVVTPDKDASTTTDSGTTIVTQTGIFNADHVYLWGNLFPVGTYDAVMDVSAQAKFWVGFNNPAQMKIRPDGRLVWDMALFVPDVIPTGLGYPTQPEANDIRLLAPGCGAGVATEFLGIFPDDGAALYGCAEFGNTKAYVEGSATVFHDDYTNIIGFGAGRTLLLLGGGPSLNLRIRKNGVDTPASIPGATLNGLGANVEHHVRFQDGAFRFAVVQSAPGNFNASLWNITLDGTATKVGDYQTGAYNARTVNNGALDKAGDLYEILFPSPTQPVEREVLRFQLNAPPASVYKENLGVTTGVRLSPKEPFLITGP